MGPYLLASSAQEVMGFGQDLLRPMWIFPLAQTWLLKSPHSCTHRNEGRVEGQGMMVWGGRRKGKQRGKINEKMWFGWWGKRR